MLSEISDPSVVSRAEVTLKTFVGGCRAMGLMRGLKRSLFSAVGVPYAYELHVLLLSREALVNAFASDLVNALVNARARAVNLSVLASLQLAPATCVPYFPPCPSCW